MSESSHSKPKPSITGAALQRGKIGTPGDKQNVQRRRTTNQPPAAGAPVSHHGVSDTASSISTSTHTKGKEYVPPVKLENTYRMEPHDGKKFMCGKVRQLVAGLMDSYLSGEDYDKDKCPTLTRDLSQMIKQRIREFGFERYKIVVTVIMGENNGQGFELASRYLWNTSTDSFESVAYKNKTLFAVANVYGVYFE